MPPSFDFNRSEFVTSASRLGECPADSRREVAFAGRSNAGKSSAINGICGRARLARSSRTPGRTRLINYFRFQEGLYLVDLPGYGFAQAPLEVKRRWQQSMDDYLRRRQALAGLVLLSDIRHPLKEFDRRMLEWAGEAGLPLLLLLSKCDKLKRGAAMATLEMVQKELAGEDGVEVQLFSVLKRQGVEEVREWLARRFEEDTDIQKT